MSPFALLCPFDRFYSYPFSFDLQQLIYYEVEEDSDDDEEEEEKKKREPGRHDASSSDDNDSTAAAHAAAIGHSPKPVKTQAVQKEGLSEDDANKKEEKAEEVKDAKGESGTKQKSDLDENPALSSDQAAPDTNGDAKEDIDKKPIAESPATPMEGVETEKDDPKVLEESTSTMDAKNENGGGGSSPRPKKRLERNPDIHLNERDEDENTALHVAILARKIEHVKLLLEAGASVRLRCDGSWPLHTAISIGAISAHRQFSYECVVALHEHGADLTVKDDSLHTPLFLACMSNLPQISSYLLSDADGLSTLNTRADRAGNRPLHAAAKYDTLDNASLSKNAVASATGQLRPGGHHHPDGSVVNATHSLPGYTGKTENVPAPSSDPPASNGAPASSTEALLTQVLLGAPGIEIDALNVMGRTPLHVACCRGNWSVVRLLLLAGASTTIADRRGYTPGQLAYKRGMPIPIDLVETLGDPPESGTIPSPRDLIVDPNGSTILICHELCLLHRTCPPILRNSPEPPPENVRRLHVLVDPQSGILRTGEFGSLLWKNEARRAAITDVLKVRSRNELVPLASCTQQCPFSRNIFFFRFMTILTLRR